MLVLAEGIDAILAHLDAPASDPWAGWNVSNGGPADAPAGSVSNDNGPVTERPVVDNTDAIAACKKALATADPGDARALEARLRLLQDDGQSLDIEAPLGLAAVSEQIGDQIVTTLPTPDLERQDARVRFAIDNQLWEFSVLDNIEFRDAFAKGGPLWLYHTGRDEVMAMPLEWRRWMVEEIALDSPRTAQEVGRDILKDAEPSGNKGVVLEGINGDE